MLIDNDTYFFMCILFTKFNAFIRVLYQDSIKNMVNVLLGIIELVGVFQVLRSVV